LDRAASGTPQITNSDFYWAAAGAAETEGMALSPIIPHNNSPAASSTQAPSKNFALKTEDFIKMMITQLQNQDPMEPAKNQELLAQMSQIGQLQSATTLQESLKGMVLQNQIGAAAGLIGKQIQGMDEQNETVSGMVNSIRVQQDGVSLELDNGKTLALSRVTSIAGAGGAGATTTPATTPAPPAA
jgi:flagellar basal-body rod modification protein FlgD